MLSKTLLSTVLYFSLVSALHFASAPPVPGAVLGEACSPTPLTPNGVHRSSGGETHCGRFEVTLRSPGVLLVAVVVPAGAVSDPLLRFPEMEGVPADGALTGSTLVRRTARWALLEVSRPGTYSLTVSPEDPTRPLGSYRVVTRFAARDTVPAELHRPEEDPAGLCGPSSPRLGPGPFTDTKTVLFEDSIDELDCDVIGALVMSPGVVRVTAQGAPLVASLYEDERCSAGSALEVGVELGDGGLITAPVFPGRLSLVLDPGDGAGGYYGLRFEYYDLCELEAGDDHGDHPLCATPLALDGPHAGELTGPWGDDVDLFTFVLTELSTVQLALTATSEAEVSLFDEAGHRLAVDWRSGEAAGNLVETLGPGRYFVRVGGLGGALGSYSLHWARR